jgi:hypothetical protein
MPRNATPPDSAFVLSTGNIKDAPPRCDEVAEAVCRGTAKPIFGLFAAVAHPPAPNLEAAFCIFRQCILERFREQFQLVPDKHFLLYDSIRLHATVVTFFQREKCAAGDENALRAGFATVGHAVSRLPLWPSEPGRICVVGARLDPRGAGYLVVEDTTGHIRRMRECFKLVMPAGGRPDGAELRVPNIYHMTALRWRTHQELLGGMSHFEEVAECFSRAWGEVIGRVEVVLDGTQVIEERLPYMQDFTVSHFSSLSENR